MKYLAEILILITGILHILFFKIESIDFMKDGVLKKFNLNKEQGAIVKIWAFNQGFYNLFLGFGLIYSLILLNGNNIAKGKFLAEYILLFITGAGVVLYFSSPKNYKAAIIQSAPAFLGFLATINIK